MMLLKVMCQGLTISTVAGVSVLGGSTAGRRGKQEKLKSTFWEIHFGNREITSGMNS